MFTGGEPTLREDLVDLLSRAETNSQVAGLLSDGLKFADPGYLDLILNTGLDHLTLIFQADQERSWKALENCLAADLFVAVHLLITAENAGRSEELLKRLAGMGKATSRLSR